MNTAVETRNTSVAGDVAARAGGSAELLFIGSFLDADAGGAQLAAQWRELLLVVTPLRHRRVVQRSAHLRRAGGGGRCGIVVKLRTGLLPFKAAEREQPARLPELIRHQVLIAQRKDRLWQRRMPMCHQAPVAQVVLSGLGQ